MATEVERRFLVDPLMLPEAKAFIVRHPTGPNNVLEDHVTHIKQGYLAGGPISVRIRDFVHQWAGNPRGHQLTVKGPGSISREEVTIDVPKDRSLELMALAEHKIDKLRTVYEIDGWLWEVDQFLGPLTGLYLAELERPDATSVDSTTFAEIKPPAFCIREVTEEKMFTNAALAVFASALANHRLWLADHFKLEQLIAVKR